MKKYTIGVDFGTLSARAILIDCNDGNEIACSEFAFPHGVMSESDFKCGNANEVNSAYQHPDDHILALSKTVREVVEKSGASPMEIAGICMDFTSCTMLPVDGNFTPLCRDKAFSDNPHAYVKLWKHHSAGEQAQRITALAKKRGEKWLDSMGGAVSSEWMLPKILETLEKAPEIYRAAEYFVESGDFLVWLITGKNVRSSCMAGFKGMWTKKDGYPSKAFLREIHPEFETLSETKLSGDVIAPGKYAGALNKYGAELLGLCEGMTVAVTIIDAHSGLPGGGVCEDGQMMMMLGTSACYVGIDKRDISVPGICGRVSDGIYPGYVAYEAGQCSVGDMFEWFMKNFVSAEYMANAEQNGQSIYEHFNTLAAQKEPGKNRVLAIDWWNGSRTPYDNPDLTGCMFGLTLSTRPEEIYLALLESVAFGARAITEHFEKSGVEIKQLFASGGIAVKNAFFMQLLANITGKCIMVSECKQAAAMGSAILAAYGAGIYASPEEAVKALSAECTKKYLPDAMATKAYGVLYEKYEKLSRLLATDYSGLIKF